MSPDQNEQFRPGRGIQPEEIIQAYNLNHNLASVIRCIAKAEKREFSQEYYDYAWEEVQEALCYLNKEIDQLESGKAQPIQLINHPPKCSPNQVMCESVASSELCIAASCLLESQIYEGPIRSFKLCRDFLEDYLKLAQKYEEPLLEQLEKINKMEPKNEQ